MTTTGFDDTIAALATPVGRSAVAVVRVSGAATASILEKLTRSESSAELSPRQLLLRRLYHPTSGELIDRALVTFFAAPRSYTGEDVAEISTHGGVLTPQLVLDALLAAGAREALPGEFTRRAVLNGKLDLLQAEGIADLIDGRSPAMHRAALHQMERGLSRRIDALRESVLRIEALVAYSIDFPEEDEPPVPPRQIIEAADVAMEQIEALLATVPQGEMLREGALVVFAGRPNSGKSSLFNALLGRERSIVTAVPGTTRDAVEADVTLSGYPFRLVDTAGIREATDPVERIGVEVAHRYLAAADILLFCIDSTAPHDAAEVYALASQSHARVLTVRTKIDLDAAVDFDSDGSLDVSVVTGEGLAALERRIVEFAFGSRRTTEEDAAVVTSARQKRALGAALAEVAEFKRGMMSGLPAAFASVHLRQAVGALEDLIGVVSTDDVLGAVFSRFCVGK